MFSQLSITNFRKYQALSLDILPHQRIVGPNGFGKTSVLEALHWCLAGFSPLSKDTGAFVPHEWKDAVPKPAFTAVEVRNDHHVIRRVVQWRPEIEGLKGTTSLLLDGKATNQRTIQKYYATVFFSPEYIDLLTLQRSKRLEWLDRIGRHFVPAYASVHNNYERVVRQRNRLLQMIRKERFLNPGYQPDMTLIETLTGQVERTGQELIALRQQVIKLLNAHWQSDSYLVEYQIVKPLHFPSEVQMKELLVGRTLRGPHLDDWSIRKMTTPLSILQWGSRGQRKLALLSLMVTLVHAYQQERGVNPVILLDDPANELDTHNAELFRTLLQDPAFQIFETHIGPPMKRFMSS